MAIIKRDWVEPAHPVLVQRFDDFIDIYRFIKEAVQLEVDATFDKISRQIGTRSGCATHEPSKPSPASRSLSSRTLASARALTSGSRRLGMNAAMPPIAIAPRRWQTATSWSV